MLLIYFIFTQLVINAFINIIFLLELDTLTNLISIPLEINDEKFILKINGGKDNLDLVQEEINFIESEKKKIRYMLKVIQEIVVKEKI